MSETEALDGAQDALVAQLVRDVLVDAAPEETAVFAAHEQEWLAGDGPTPERRDEMLGFGAEAAVVLLTPYVVAAAKSVVGYVARTLADLAAEVATEAVTEEATPVVVRWLRRVFHVESPAEPPEVPLPAPVALPPDLARRVHDVALGTCQDMGLDEGDARLIADAVAGRLALPA